MDSVGARSIMKLEVIYINIVFLKKVDSFPQSEEEPLMTGDSGGMDVAACAVIATFVFREAVQKY